MVNLRAPFFFVRRRRLHGRRGLKFRTPIGVVHVRIVAAFTGGVD